jgi:hypothetical protein
MPMQTEPVGPDKQPERRVSFAPDPIVVMVPASPTAQSSHAVTDKILTAADEGTTRALSAERERRDLVYIRTLSQERNNYVVTLTLLGLLFLALYYNLFIAGTSQPAKPRLNL